MSSSRAYGVRLVFLSTCFETYTNIEKPTVFMVSVQFVVSALRVRQLNGNCFDVTRPFLAYKFQAMFQHSVLRLLGMIAHRLVCESVRNQT